MRKISNKLIEEALHLADNEHSKVGEREKRLFGLSSYRMRAAINNLCSVPNTKYLEIGLYRGATLISAAIGNKTCKLVGIENFSYDDREPKKKAPAGTYWTNMESQLMDNISRYRDPDSGVNVDNITVIKEDFAKADIKELGPFDICFFDVSPVNKEIYKQFVEKIIPHMAKECTLVFSNYSNEAHAKQIEEVLNDNADKIVVNKQFQRISGGLSDDTQYYSGILVLSATIETGAVKSAAKPVTKVAAKT